MEFRVALTGNFLNAINKKLEKFISKINIFNSHTHGLKLKSSI